VRAWVVDVDALSEAELQRLEAVLDTTEREILGRLRHDADRRAYGAAHGLLRYAVAPDAPGAVRLGANERGRPFLVAPTAPRCDVSLSHARGAVAVAVAEARGGADPPRVGVDVEALQTAAVARELAGTVLSDAERAGLEGLGDDDLRRRFTAHWTLKEAHIKCTGEGISAPLREITFDPGGEGRLVAAPGVTPAHVHSRAGTLAAGHGWALVVHSDAAFDVEVRTGLPWRRPG